VVNEPEFWSRVEKDQSGHWYWKGVKNWAGYGFLTRDGKRVYAHRYAYEVSHGPIPTGACVLHSCDFRLCVRPDHLHLGTRPQNSAEMVARGRSQKGQDHSRALLTDAEVRAIHACREAGWTQARIGVAFGISRSTAGLILQGKRWGHLGVERAS